MGAECKMTVVVSGIISGNQLLCHVEEPDRSSVYGRSDLLEIVRVTVKFISPLFSKGYGLLTT